MEIFIWIGLSILVGIYADKLERNGLGYFCLACFLLSPLFAWLLLLAIGKNPETAS